MANNKNIILRILTLSICIVFLSNRTDAQKKFSETLAIHLNAIKNADLVSFEPTVSDSIIHISPMGEKNQTKAQFIKLHQDWFNEKTGNGKEKYWKNITIIHLAMP